MFRIKAESGISKIRQTWLRMTTHTDDTLSIPVYIVDHGKKKGFKVAFREDEILLFPEEE